MNILGIGPLELTFIVIIALIVIGPNDLVKTGRTLGRWMRKIVLSPEWKAVQNASREIRTLPNKLIREAGMEDAQQALKGQVDDVKKIGRDLQRDYNQVQTDLSSWVTPAQTIAPSKKSTEEIKSSSVNSSPIDTSTENN